jgi:hypothetical protein
LAITALFIGFQAYVMRAGSDDMRENLISDQRPWISTSVCRLAAEVTVGTEIRISCGISNTGRTPALDVKQVAQSPYSLGV